MLNNVSVAKTKLSLEVKHKCFIQPAKPEESCEKYFFDDFEARQGVYIDNYICCTYFNGKCWVTEGDTCVEAFYRNINSRPTAAIHLLHTIPRVMMVTC